MSPKNKKN